jgi:hypothetical protein
MSQSPNKLRLSALIALAAVLEHIVGTYTSLIYLASSMILVPYLWSAAYGLYSGMLSL